MYIKYIVNALIVFTSFLAFSQDNLYTSLTIDPVLKKNANAVVRNNDVHIVIESQRKIKIALNRIVTVYNEKGMRHVKAVVGYDNYIKIKKIEAIIFNEQGKEIKKIKKKNFIDRSAVDGGTLYSDSRVLFMAYTPTSYPYTVKFSYEIESQNTATIPSWRPIDDYFLSIEKSSYSIHDVSNLELRFKEKNFSDFQIETDKSNTLINYSVINAIAIKPEDLSPSLSNFTPEAMIAVGKFHYNGVDGQANNWVEFGDWIQNSLLEGRNSVSEKTKKEILGLVSGIEDPIEKARMIYEYVQNNTRYISVQVGIGGIQPISAIEVDRLKYGDCKGLTNYTQALLKIAEVPSYYTVVEAGNEKIDFDTDFASLEQGNHIILGIPNEGEIIWLDCTSQIHPFGFIGDFTDDRNVLIVKENASEILKTTEYLIESNHQLTKAKIRLNSDTSIEADVMIKTKGIQYDNRFFIERESKEDIIEYYKNYWNYVNNLEVETFDFNNNLKKVEFLENVTISARNYASIVGERFIFSPNVFNKNRFVPDRYRNRKLSLKIQRGYLDEDDFSLIIPDGYELEAMPENILIENKFGEYSIHLEFSNKEIRIKRKLLINSGEYPKMEYKVYRNFRKAISKHDDSKIVLKKIM